MLYAIKDGIRKRPEIKGERAVCPGCRNDVLSVIPLQNVKHWRHRSGDCDPWSEPEGEWHLAWKNRFRQDEVERTLVDPSNGELHRADVMVEHDFGRQTIVELQHSSIKDDERISREAFYGAHGRRMFWLLHLHDEHNFNGTYFSLAVGMIKREVVFGGRKFWITHFPGKSQFFKRWVRSSRHVFLSYGRHVFYLATPFACADLVRSLGPKEIAISAPLTVEEFVSAVRTW